MGTKTYANAIIINLTLNEVKINSHFKGERTDVHELYLFNFLQDTMIRKQKRITYTLIHIICHPSFYILLH